MPQGRRFQEYLDPVQHVPDFMVARLHPVLIGHEFTSMALHAKGRQEHTAERH